MLYLFQENKSYGVKPICIHPLMYVIVRNKWRRAHHSSSAFHTFLIEDRRVELTTSICFPYHSDRGGRVVITRSFYFWYSSERGRNSRHWSSTSAFHTLMAEGKRVSIQISFYHLDLFKTGRNIAMIIPPAFHYLSVGGGVSMTTSFFILRLLF